MQKDTEPGTGDRGPKGPKFCPQAQIKEETYAIKKNHHLLHQQSRTEYLVWALPLATAKLGGVPRYRITITFIFTTFIGSILLIIF